MIFTNKRVLRTTSTILSVSGTLLLQNLLTPKMLALLEFAKRYKD